MHGNACAQRCGAHLEVAVTVSDHRTVHTGVRASLHKLPPLGGGRGGGSLRLSSSSSSNAAALNASSKKRGEECVNCNGGG